MIVKKARGGEEKYKSYKVVRSCERSGFTESQGKRIERNVRKKIGDTIDVEELEKIIYKEMKSIKESYAMIYRLRESIAALNPEKHEFEFFIAKLFDEMGFDSKRSPKPKPVGECIEHEIDVLADKNPSGEEGTHIVECKHHYHFHRFTGLGVPMRERARLLDLRKGFKKGKKNSINPEKAWVFTNTKLSDHAKKYSKCKGINLIGWDYPEDSLAKLTEKYKVYPVDILMLNKKEKEEFSKNQIITVRDFLNFEIEKINIKSERRKELKQGAEELMES